MKKPKRNAKPKRKWTPSRPRTTRYAHYKTKDPETWHKFGVMQPCGCRKRPTLHRIRYAGRYVDTECRTCGHRRTIGGRP
jgi:hypothetical protein